MFISVPFIYILVRFSSGCFEWAPTPKAIVRTPAFRKIQRLQATLSLFPQTFLGILMFIHFVFLKAGVDRSWKQVQMYMTLSFCKFNRVLSIQSAGLAAQV